MDKSRVEPTLFFIEKISFSLKFFSGHFYGQSFIKTVRGPCLWCAAKKEFQFAYMIFIFNGQDDIYLAGEQAGLKLLMRWL